jgi:hypothetical protein
VIINSPVGRFPFEITSVSARSGKLTVQGRMGTWPTSVEVGHRDIPRVALRIWPLLGAALASSVAITLGVRRFLDRP